MKGGSRNPLWVVMSGTIMAYPAFLPSLATARRFDPDGWKSRDVRIGYASAIGYSLALTCVVASDYDPGKAFAAWLFTSGFILALYEFALRDEKELRPDAG